MQQDTVAGTPANKWTLRFMDMALRSATWSKDPSTKVGAVLVSPMNGVISTGFNGFPHCVEDSADRLSDRSAKLRFTVHAELNALLWALRHNCRVDGATIFVTHPPCAHCAAALAQAGVKRVVADWPAAAFIDRWMADMLAGSDMFAETGINYQWLDNAPDLPLLFPAGPLLSAYRIS